MSVAAPQSPFSVHCTASPRGRVFNPQCCSNAKPRRLRQNGLSETERHWAVATHLSPLAVLIFWPLIFSPLVIWLIRKDHSVFNDDHGRETVNFAISFVLLHIILTVTIFGVLLMPVLWIVGLIAVIRGAVAAGGGEYFRYPMTFRFL